MSALIEDARRRLIEGHPEEAERLLWEIDDAGSGNRSLILAHLAASHTARANMETARALTRAALYHRRPSVQPAPPGQAPAPDAPRILVLFAAHNQPFKADAAGRASLGLGTNLHVFLDPTVFHIVHAFAETLTAAPEHLHAPGRIDAVLNLSVEPVLLASGGDLPFDPFSGFLEGRIVDQIVLERVPDVLEPAATADGFKLIIG